MPTPLKFAPPYSVVTKKGLGGVWVSLLHQDTVIASFSVETWGDADAAKEAAWNYIYGPSDELIAQSIARDVAELPDRNSPEDQPEMMLVSAAEIEAIVMANLSHR